MLYNDSVVLDFQNDLTFITKLVIEITLGSKSKHKSNV